MEHQDKQQQEYRDLMKSIEMPFDIEAQWDDIEQKLPSKSKKRRGIIFWFTGLCVVVALGVLFQQNWDNDTIVNQISQLDNKIKTDNYINEISEYVSPEMNLESSIKNRLIQEKGKVDTDNTNDSKSSRISFAKNRNGKKSSSNTFIIDSGTNNEKKSVKISVEREMLGSEIVADSIVSDGGYSELIGISTNAKEENPRSTSKISINPNPAQRLKVNMIPLLSMVNDKIRSIENSYLIVPSINIEPVKSNNWSLGFAQQIGCSKLLYGNLPNENKNPLNDEIKSTYLTKTSLLAMRKMNERFSILGGLTYRENHERLNAERIIDVQEKQVLSDKGSVYINNFGEGNFYKAVITETTTTSKKVGHSNVHKSIGLQLGVRCEVHNDLYLSVSAAQFMTFASRGKAISAQNTIAGLNNEIRNGGIDIEVVVGYSLNLSGRLKFDIGINATAMRGQQSHLEFMNRSGYLLGGSLGFRYLMKRQ